MTDNAFESISVCRKRQEGENSYGRQRIPSFPCFSYLTVARLPNIGFRVHATKHTHSGTSLAFQVGYLLCHRFYSEELYGAFPWD